MDDPPKWTSGLVSMINQCNDQEWMAVIAGGLARNTSLKVLDLTGDFVNARGLNAVARALSTNTTLEELVLWPSASQASPISLMENACAEALGQLLASNTGVRRLEINGCCMDVPGLVRLAHGLKVNTRLEKLVLKENRLNESSTIWAFGETLAINITSWIF